MTNVEERNKFLTENHGLLWCAAMQWAKHYERNVDDVLEMVYEAALKCYDKYDPEKGKFGAHLNYYIRHAFWEEKKKRTCKSRNSFSEVSISDKEEYDEMAMQIPDSTDVEETCVNGEYWKWAMGLLTEMQRKVIVCLYEKELGLTETAKLLGMSKQCVQQHEKCAIKKLKKAEGLI